MDDLLIGMNKGEVELYELLRSYEDETFKVIPNVLLKRHKEGTNQIDLLVISKKGVFIFEMKDFSGMIFGNEDHKDWTQILNNGHKNSKKYKFRNPVKQNDNHIKTIKHLLNTHEFYYPIFNVVVFGHNATLKDVTTSIDVVTLDNAYTVIEKYPDVVISNETIDSIYSLIKENSLVGQEAMNEHVNYAKSFSELNNNNANLESENLDTIDWYQKVDKKANNPKYTNKNANNQTNNIEETIIIFLTLIFLIIIVVIQPILALFLFALFLPKSRYKRKRILKAKVGVYLVVVMLFLGVALYMENIENPFFEKTESGTKIISMGNASQSHIKSQDTYQVVTAESEVLFDSVSEVEAATIEETHAEISIEKDKEKDKEKENEFENIADADTSDLAVVLSPVSEIQTVVTEAKGHIIIGSKIESVVAILGKPDLIENNKWLYKNSYFDVDDNNLIMGWQNNYKQLNDVMYLPTGGIINIGSNKSNVISSLGSPTNIDPRNPYKFIYQNSFVLFDDSFLVIGWQNNYNQLSTGLHLPEKGKIDIGSKMDEVLTALGSPTEIDPRNPYKYIYQNSFVIFNDDFSVIGWQNNYNQLDAGLNMPIKGKIDIGSTRSEVLSALGSPTEIDPRNSYKFNYQNSVVMFDENFLVAGWQNYYSQLNLAMYMPGKGKIDIGSTRAQVISALGAPTEIDARNPYKLIYQNSVVIFDENFLVVGWQNYYSQLNLGMFMPGKGKIDVGSSRAQVINALGSPTEIDPRNPLKLVYQNSYILFNTNWEVESWQNYYDQLSQVLQGNAD